MSLRPIKVTAYVTVFNDGGVVLGNATGRSGR